MHMSDVRILFLFIISPFYLVAVNISDVSLEYTHSNEYY